MVRGDKNPLAAVATPSEEGEEIDRIMKEIEDLEKKMDGAPEAESSNKAEPDTSAESDNADSDEGALASEGGNVVALRPETAEVSESMAETDAVPAPDAPLMRDDASAGDGALSMKIGGCAEVALEFTRAGMTVSLVCKEDGLCITTDQGAEFRIPFKRTA